MFELLAKGDRRRARSGFSANFDFDERGLFAQLPCLFDRQRCGVFFAIREQRQMVVLDQNRIAEVQAMGANAAEMQRSLVEQPPWGFARADHARFRSASGDALLHGTRRASDSAHPLHQIQADAFKREQFRLFSLR
jgi:hypothetical protein